MSPLCDWVLHLSMQQGFIVLIFLLFNPLASFADTAYGTYGLYSQGSTRILAMGGAIVGLADDASSLNINPAGLAMGRYKYDIRTGTNRVVNKELATGTSTQRVGVPYFINFYAGALQWGHLAFGGGYHQPYNLEPRQRTNSPDLNRDPPGIIIESTDVFVAYRFGKNLAVGVTVHSEKATISYENSAISVAHLQDVSDMVYPTVGFSLKSNSRGGLGISYTPERRYEFENKQVLNGTVTSATSNFNVIFRDVVIPGKFVVGGHIRLGRKLIWVFDMDFYQKITDAVYVHDQSPSSDNKIIEKQATVIHGGFEIYIIRNKKMEFIWRGGGYKEPTRFEENKDRFHFTMGVEFRWGPVAVSAAYDQADEFTNTAQSIGLSIDALNF